MKGFIEIHRQSGGVCLISVSGIDTIATGGDNYRDSYKATIWLKSDPDNEAPINPVESYDEVKRLIKQAQEDRKTGRWFVSACTTCGVCSACGEPVSDWHDCKFCPHCGAEMEGEL